MVDSEHLTRLREHIDGLQRWYYRYGKPDDHLLNEIIYAATLILYECVQALNKGNFSHDFIEEKLLTISSLNDAIAREKVIQ